MKEERKLKTSDLEEKDERHLREVEEALFRRATGYEDSSGKFIQPDVRAAMYWLENRCPGRWKKNRRELAPDEDDSLLSDDEKKL